MAFHLVKLSVKPAGVAQLVKQIIWHHVFFGFILGRQRGETLSYQNWWAGLKSGLKKSRVPILGVNFASDLQDTCQMAF